MPTLAEEFAAFWTVYPRRVCRQDAMKAYAKARVMATAEDIQAGVVAFVGDLSPEDFTKERLRYLPHAATWLNKERWLDEYDVPAPKPVEVDWFDECKQMHGGECSGRLRHTNKVNMDAWMARHKAEAS